MRMQVEGPAKAVRSQGSAIARAKTVFCRQYYLFGRFHCSVANIAMKLVNLPLVK